MLTITATVTKIEPDYVYLSEIKEYGRDIQVGTTRMFTGRWSKRIKTKGSLIAFTGEVSHRTVTGFDGEDRYQRNLVSIKKPSLAQIVRSD